MTIVVENADKDLVKIIKHIAKLGKAKVKPMREKGIDRAIKEYEREKDTLKTYKNFDEFEKDLFEKNA
ncbi:hypothetical protein ACWIUD_06255 [Helicobacter sp. 23-1044]